MYQVIYSSVVIWCAILTYFLMGRTLTKLQWVAIIGTSSGLAICSLGNMGISSDDSGKHQNKVTTGTLMMICLLFFIGSAAILMVGTLLTLGGTFFYCKCVCAFDNNKEG